MNKELFLAMSPDKRVEEVNKMLQTASLKEVADEIGIAYSTFLKEMTVGDYVYIQRDNRYYKFIRDVGVNPQFDSSEDYREELHFLRENIDTLKRLVNSGHRPPLILDKQIYSKSASFSNKSIKMNEEVYEKFTKHCSEHFPQFRLQDLIAQSLLDFIEKY